jgi:putative transposase
MEYRKGSHTVYNIQYHFVWVTKYRYHVLEGEVKLRVREIIRQNMSATRFADRTRARKQRPCSHLGFSPNAYVCESDNAENQGPFFARVATGVPTS